MRIGFIAYVIEKWSYKIRQHWKRDLLKAKNLKQYSFTFSFIVLFT